MFGCFHGVDDVGSSTGWWRCFDATNRNEEEDPRQPSKEAKTMYMYWNDSNTKAWTHFADNDTQSLEEYFEEKENGEIKIDFQFRMEPISR